MNNMTFYSSLCTHHLSLFSTTVFLIFDFYFSVDYLTSFGKFSMLIINKLRGRKKTKLVRGLQLPDNQMQFLRLTTFDNVFILSTISIFNRLIIRRKSLEKNTVAHTYRNSLIISTIPFSCQQSCS